MTIYLTVGLPGAGKTTRARELEASASALRLTPDEWLQAVFPDDGPTGWRVPERIGQRDRIEGRLIELGLRAARLGLAVVLDFGLWSADERSALRWLAQESGVEARVIYLPIDLAEQRRRIRARFESGPGHFQLDDDELERWQQQFEVPDATELSGGPIPAVPAGHPDWASWRLGDLALALVARSAVVRSAVARSAAALSAASARLHRCP